jgi:hypothetical protein
MYNQRAGIVRRWRPWAVLALALGTPGCIATTHNPERLIPIAAEMNALALDQAGLLGEYQNAIRTNSTALARTIRNEIIAQRMYAIDVQYTQYETALTREGQEIGFGALTTATGLSTAATLVVPAATKTILSAAATGVLAAKGHYESQVLLAQSLRTIQKQMRASRNTIATGISAKMAHSVLDYPLWTALSDVEDYYNAGTLTTGVIDVSTTVSIKEDETKSFKEVVTQAPVGQRPDIIKNGIPAGPSIKVVATAGRDGTTVIIRAWLSPSGILNTGRRDLIRAFLAQESPGLQVTTFLEAKEYADLRLRFARQQRLLP